MDFSRSVINALLPLGSAWAPAVDDDYDLLLDGIADNTESVRQAMDNLRYIRDPSRTPILSDLEKEFAIVPVANATESERRQRLAQIMFRRSELPTPEDLQAQLLAAGFTGLFVYPNSPAVDPDIFLAQNFAMSCGELLPGGNDAQCGEPEAIAAQSGGELIINGEFYVQSPNYTTLCGDTEIEAGEPAALAGMYDSMNLALMEYQVPGAADAGYWSFIFFIGGPATRDPITGALTEISIASIPIERRLEFRRIVLRYKAMFSWGAAIVCYS